MNCICGAKMIWNSDFDFEDYGYDENGVVSHYYCSDEKCGCSMDLYIPDRTNNDDINVYPKLGSEDNE